MNSRQEYFDESQKSYQIIFNRAFHEALDRECSFFYPRKIPRVKPLEFEGLAEYSQITYSGIFLGEFDELRISQSVEQAGRSKGYLLGKTLHACAMQVDMHAVENIVQVAYPQPVKDDPEMAMMHLDDVVIMDGGAHCSPRIIWQAFWKYRARIPGDVLA